MLAEYLFIYYSTTLRFSLAFIYCLRITEVHAIRPHIKKKMQPNRGAINPHLVTECHFSVNILQVNFKTQRDFSGINARYLKINMKVSLLSAFPLH